MRVPDLDGDGLDDVALGNIFETVGDGTFGKVRLLSTGTGELLGAITNPGLDHTVFGSSLIAGGDLDFDGTPDLLIGHSPYVFAYSLKTTELLFTITEPNSPSFGLSISQLPGADPEGFASFAVLEELESRVRVLRYAPLVGTGYCSATPNSTGVPATISALGTTSLQFSQTRLAVDGLPAGGVGLFIGGSAEQQVPFGLGSLCVAAGGTNILRLAIGQADATGRFTHALDPAANVSFESGSTWNFQVLYRDVAAGAPGFNTSDGLTLTFVD